MLKTRKRTQINTWMISQSLILVSTNRKKGCQRNTKIRWQQKKKLSFSKSSRIINRIKATLMYMTTVIK